MAKAKSKSKAGATSVSLTKPASPAQAAESAERERKYQVEDGLRTLTRAEEIKGDPDLMRDVAAHAKEQAEVAARSARMVKGGLISDKQKARMDAKAEK